jgi:hypothetical protein
MTGRTQFIQVMRAVMVPLIVLNLVLGTLVALVGHVRAEFPFNFAVAAFLVLVMHFQTRAIRRMNDGRKPTPLIEPVLRHVTGRQRPDYAHIATMERELGMGPVK